MEALYQNTKTIKRLKEYFQPYINLLTKPSGSKLFLVLLAMISMQFVTSVSFIYKWFLSDICDLSLNAYYHLLSYTEIPLDAFFKITVKNALSLITKELKDLPVFLIVDDTLQAKYGTHFECYQKMFDHAKHNGSNYLKGHCFVSLMISVPVMVNGSVRYLNIPVGFRLRKEKENKLEIASKMIETAMKILAGHPMAILLCDSWYPKGAVRGTVAKYENLNLISNVRIDTNLFELPPPHTGKRGRPAVKGRKLDICTDFHFIRVENYYIAVKRVLTNLFDEPVYLTITTPNPDSRNTYRLFISTLMPEAISRQFNGYEKTLSDSLMSRVLWLLPLYLYSFRWPIEVFFYEMKTFWSFGLYMLRSKTGVEHFVNLLAMSYACMRTLPVIDRQFELLANESVQTAKYVIGNSIRNELFLWRFVSDSENGFNSSDLFANPKESCSSSKSFKAS